MEQNVTETVELFVVPPKEVETKHYEMLVLIGGSATEEQAQTIIGEVKAVMTALGATITLEQAWGRRPLAYTVAGSKSGTYFVMEFDLATDKLPELNEKLRIRKDVTRFLIVTKRVKSAEEIAEEQRVRDKIDARKKTKMLAQLDQQEAAPSHKQPRTQPVTAAASEASHAPTPATTQAPDASQTTAVSRSEATPAEQQKKSENIDSEIEKLLSNDIDV